MKWQLEQFLDKDVIFVGVGQGRAMAGIQTFLERHVQMRSFTGLDKTDEDQDLGYLLKYNPKHTVFIKNEAIPGRELPVPYITPLQLFFRLVTQTGATTVGITGTKGKSTTTALTAHILKEAGRDVVLAGNIGVSPLTALDNANEQTIFVLELSSHQLSDLKVSPHISACINLYNDHTIWHGSLENYWEAKHNIMRFAGTNDVFVYNPDFPALQRWAKEASCQTIAIDPSTPYDMSKAQLFGDHNRLNILVAREIARQFGVSDEVVQTAVDSFVPLRHRMQIVATKATRTYIDDAIGMTPDAAMASLTAIHEKLGSIGCVLLGGYDRNYDFRAIMDLIANLNVPALVLFPNTIEKMKAAMPQGYHPETFETRSMEEAVAWAATHAPEHSVVALSTAAPSYSLWRDFEEKGDIFQVAVEAL